MTGLWDSMRVMGLMLCIIGIIMRRPFIRSQMGRIYWKHRGLWRWRQMRDIYARYGIDLRVP